MTRRRVAIVAGALLSPFALLAILVAREASLPASTEPIDGTRAIAEFTSVDTGTGALAMLLRGRDRESPILLYVHQGPGFASIPLSAAFTRPLEERFVVAQWDQRGAGASCGTTMPPPGRFLDAHVEDAQRVLDDLGQRFGPRRILLVGHGTGAAIAAVLAHRRPEAFAGLVLVAPVVATTRNEAWVVDTLKASWRGAGQDPSAWADVTVPYPDPETMARVHDAVTSLGGTFASGRSLVDFLPTLLAAREHTLSQRLQYLDCLDASVRAAWASLWEIDLGEQAPRIDVPVTVLLGEADRGVAPPVIEEWMRALQAPRKETRTMPGVGHYPMLEAPEAFAAEVSRTISGER